MGTDETTWSRRTRHRVGLVVAVEGALPSEVQERAVRAFASLATALLLDEPQEAGVSLLEHLEDGGLVAAAGSR
jgi:hypothetical protein